MSTALQLRRRSQLLGTPVFVEGAVERLGFVSQVWVDLHTLRVAGWSIRRDRSPESSIAVALSASKLLGTGALLLESDALSTSLKTDAYVRLIPQMLKTQSGVSLGRLKDFTLDMASGAIASVRTSGTGIPLLPPAVDSTFEIPRTDLISNGSLTAADGAEERVTLLKRGLLEQAGIGKFNWSLPLSASKSPALDESTLEAIAEATASPLSVESVTAETTAESGGATSSTAPAGVETGASSPESSSEATDSEDAGTDPSDTAIFDDKPLERAIDLLTSTVQPLLQKLPLSLRQRLGLSDSETTEEASQSSSSSAPESLEGSIDAEEEAESSVEPEVTSRTSDSNEPEIEATVVDSSADVSTARTVETVSESEADSPAESSEDAANTQETNSHESVATESPDQELDKNSSEVVDQTTQESEDSEDVATTQEASPQEPVIAESSDEELDEDSSEFVDQTTLETEDSEHIATTQEASLHESVAAESPEEEFYEDSSEVVDQTTQESEQETQQNVDSASGDEGNAESEPPSVTAEVEADTSDADEDLEQAEETDTEIEPSAEAETDSSEIDTLETDTTDGSEGHQGLTETAVPATSLTAVTGIAREQSSQDSSSSNTSDLAGESATQPSASVPPTTAASQTSDDIVPPALQTSLPRVPHAVETEDTSQRQAKPGTPLQNSVSLPQSKGHVPKSGGSFEPKVKGS